MNITVLTPDKEIFHGTVESVKVPGVSGEFQVLKNHAPIVSALGKGNITIVTSIGEYRYFDGESGSIKTASQPGRRIVYAIHAGFIEVLNNEVSLLIQGVQEKGA